MDKLAISEHFYSIQGEGKYTGIPSVFLRLKGCNLTCGGKKTVSTKKLDSGATWRCDTIEVWLTGNATSFKSLFLIFESHNYIDYLKQGAHLIITGGEPLLQQKQLANFFSSFYKHYSFVPFIEVETNGTIAYELDFDRYVDQYNVSLKLANSGMSYDQRVNQYAIDLFLKKTNIIYKFVVSTSKDVDEIFTQFVDKYSLNLKYVYLMPAASSREELQRLEPILIELCKQRCVNYSTRLHIQIWDRLTGV